MKVSTVEEMRGLDHTAIERYGIPGEILMENAGEAVYFVILNEIGVQGHRFAVLCGGGHNGGDGLVVARKLHSSGGDVRVLLLSDPDRFDDAPRLHLEVVRRAGIPLEVSPDAEAIRSAISGSDVVIDALLGTGIDREVRGHYRDAVAAINGSGASVVSIDIPSGVDGNTGRVWGAAVNSDLTVTFGLPKRGNLLYPGAERCGTLFVSHISFPPQLTGGDGIAVEISVPPPLPPRRRDGHKGAFGDALFIAGAASYFGAPAFAALAMLKAGAVTRGSPPRGRSSRTSRRSPPRWCMRPRPRQRTGAWRRPQWTISWSSPMWSTSSWWVPGCPSNPRRRSWSGSWFPSSTSRSWWTAPRRVPSLNSSPAPWPPTGRATPS